MSVRVLCCSLPAAVLGVALGVEAQTSQSRVTDDPAVAESFIRNPQFTVMVVKILEADVVEGTHETPPAGSFRVLEVLRGEQVKPGSYRYRILSPRTQADGPNWGETPLIGPRAGSELIVFSYVGEKSIAEGDSIILQGPLVEAGQSQRVAVTESLVHDSPLLLPLFWIVLIAPVLGLFPRYGWLAPVIAFAAYGVYEALMSPTYNIRVDVLLLWPALGASMIVPIVAYAWRKQRRPEV